MRRRKPWVMYFPRGLREQPAWVCIGILFSIVGCSYLIEVATNPITAAIGETGLRVWGGILTFSGCTLVVAVIRGRPALEKLALRMLVLSALAYIGYLSTVVPLTRMAATLLFGGAVILSAAFRIWHLSRLVKAMKRGDER